MKKILLVFVLIVVYICSFSETVSYTRYQSGETPLYETLDWAGVSEATISIPEFDSSLGTLTKVEFSFQFDITQDIFVESTNDVPVNIKVRGNSEIMWTNLPNSISDVDYTTRTNDIFYDYAIYDDNTDYAGPSGRTFLDLTDSDNSSYEFTNDLTAFIGTGTMDMNVNTSSYYSVFGGSNMDIILSSKALATASITYTYDSITLPVELASFSAVMTSSNFARIQWATHTESELLGYNIFRNESDNFDASIKINLTPINPTNSSEYHSYSYTDENVEENTSYYYWLESRELSNVSEIHGPVMVTTQSIGEDVGDIITNNAAGIKSIYPNPFNPNTTVRFFLRNDSNVKFEIYNLKGQRVHSSDLGTKVGNKYHTVTWNGKNDRNQDCSSGTYFFKVTSNSFSQTSKAILSK